MKLGITMEGGASRTVFSCGVTDLFLEENIMPDYLIGVSAGISYGVSYISKQKGRNIEVAEKYMGDERYMGLSHLLNKKEKSFYNIPFVFDEVPNKLEPFDYEEFCRFPGKVEAVVTNIHTGSAEYMEVPKDDRKFTVLVASCSLPILFQPVKINKGYYLDGGVADSVPYSHAIEEGCDKNIVILTRERDYTKTTDRTIKLASKIYKDYPKLVAALESRADNYNCCMKELFEAERKGKIFVIAPEDTYGVHRTESDPKQLRRLYEEGYLQAKESMHALRLYLQQ